MSTPIDLSFRKGDDIRPKWRGWNNSTFWRTRTIEGFTETGLPIVGGKTGPKYNDTVTGEVIEKSKDWEFACHHAGAPFENVVLDEAGMYADGVHSGLAIGLSGQFYQAGGPWDGKLSEGRNSCRHFKQHDEFVTRNNKAWRLGWAAGQERAKMRQKLDFNKPLRTVRDNKPVYYVGRLAPGSQTHVVSVDGNPPPVMIDAYGKVDNRSDPYGMVIENVPDPVTTVIRFRPDGTCLGADYKGPTTPEDILVTVTIAEGMVTFLEPNR